MNIFLNNFPILICTTFLRPSALFMGLVVDSRIKTMDVGNHCNQIDAEVRPTEYNSLAE